MCPLNEVEIAKII